MFPKCFPSYGHIFTKTNDRTRCYDVTIDATILIIIINFFLHVRPRTSNLFYAKSGTVGPLDQIFVGLQGLVAYLPAVLLER